MRFFNCLFLICFFTFSSFSSSFISSNDGEQDDLIQCTFDRSDLRQTKSYRTLKYSTAIIGIGVFVCQCYDDINSMPQKIAKIGATAMVACVIKPHIEKLPSLLAWSINKCLGTSNKEVFGALLFFEELFCVKLMHSGVDAIVSLSIFPSAEALPVFTTNSTNVPFFDIEKCGFQDDVCPISIKSVCGDDIPCNAKSVVNLFFSPKDTEVGLIVEKEKPYLFGCGTKDEQAQTVIRRLIKPIISWLEKNKDGERIILWVDSSKSNDFAIENTKNLICNELLGKGFDGKNVAVMDVQQINCIKEQLSFLFDNTKNAYWRFDITRLIIAFLNLRYLNAEQVVYADLDVNGVSFKDIFNIHDLARLDGENNGFLMGPLAHSGFLIFTPKADPQIFDTVLTPSVNALLFNKINVDSDYLIYQSYKFLPFFNMIGSKTNLFLNFERDCLLPNENNFIDRYTMVCDCFARFTDNLDDLADDELNILSLGEIKGIEQVIEVVGMFNRYMNYLIENPLFFRQYLEIFNILYLPAKRESFSCND